MAGSEACVCVWQGGLNTAPRVRDAVEFLRSLLAGIRWQKIGCLMAVMDALEEKLLKVGEGGGLFGIMSPSSPSKLEDRSPRWTLPACPSLRMHAGRPGLLLHPH